MPKVSAQYRDARREQILEAARTCFLRDGFHKTSMQDLFAESGLSSGAFYGYFPSKDDVIMAIAEDNMRENLELLRSMTTAEHGASVGETLAESMDLIRTKNRREGVGALAIQVWAEVLRNDRLRVRFRALVGQLKDELAEVAHQAQLRGELPASVSPRALAEVFVSTAAGYIVQLALLGPAAVRDTPATVRALWPGNAGRIPEQLDG